MDVSDVSYKKTPFRIIPTSKSLEKFPGWFPILKGPFRNISLLAPLPAQQTTEDLAVGWRPHLHIASRKVVNSSWLAGSAGFSLLRWLVKDTWKMWVSPAFRESIYIFFLKMPPVVATIIYLLGGMFGVKFPFPVIDNPEEYFGMFRWEGSLPSLKPLVLGRGLSLKVC